MPRLFGREISRRASMAIVLFEVAIFAVVVAVVALRMDYYIGFGGRRPNVVIFLVDALRADHLGCYGHDIDTSPFIDKIAKRGVLFENAFSQHSYTQPSVTSIFTSLYSLEHHVIRFKKDHKKPVDVPDYGFLLDDYVTVAEAFRTNGYHTAAFVTNVWVDPTFNLDQGFDDFLPLSRSFKPDGTPLRVLNLPANLVNEELEKYLVEYHSSNLDKFLEKFRIYKKPLFIYVHYMDVHNPYNPPPPFDQIFANEYINRTDHVFTDMEKILIGYQIRKGDTRNFYLSLYDGQIRFFDFAFQQFYTWLDKTKSLDPAIMVLTADHGEAFGEHGRYIHGKASYNELIHVPLIMWDHGDIPENKRLSNYVELLDLAPTLLDLAGLDIPGQFNGTSLRGTIDGSATLKSRVWSEIYDSDKPVIVTIRDGRKWYYGLLQNKIVEVYDLRTDPGEKNNLIDSVPEEDLKKLTFEMRKWYNDKRSRIKYDKPPEVEIPDDIKENLRALGYLK